MLVALGSTYAGADLERRRARRARSRRPASETGELAWRLPLHPEYKELTKGTVADLTNASAKRKAGTIYAGSFLEEFVDGKPWVHLDIAGTAWDVGREYVGKGPSGFGGRLLVELARSLGEPRPRAAAAAAGRALGRPRACTRPLASRAERAGARGAGADRERRAGGRAGSARSRSGRCPAGALDHQVRLARVAVLDDDAARLEVDAERREVLGEAGSRA